MKRRVKYFKRKRGAKVYRHPWIGYSYRRDNGTPDFKREISLAGLEESEVREIDAVLRGERSESTGKVVFEHAFPTEGECCPLNQFGYNRDGKKGKMQIVIGLLTDAAGRPLAVEVFEGNTEDQSTVMDRIDYMRRDFGIDEMIFVGDRGMVTRARRSDLQASEYEGVKYITALKRQEFLQFLDDRSHPIKLGFFDRHNLVEVKMERVRYILSFNPEKDEDESPSESCHSVRTVWETLNEDTQIGRVRIGERLVEQISPIPARAAQMLDALGARPTPQRLARLKLVG